MRVWRGEDASAVIDARDESYGEGDEEGGDENEDEDEDGRCFGGGSHVCV